MSLVINTLNKNNFFNINLYTNKKKSFIRMELKTREVTTSTLDVLSVLKNNLPSIFNTICYNDKNLPFHIEVKNTEIGHLYEHILLEYISLLHFSKTQTPAEFIGVTSWNWQKNPRGTFNIVINVGKKDSEIVKNAMEMTTKLLCKILSPLKPEVRSYEPAVPETMELVHPVFF